MVPYCMAQLFRSSPPCDGSRHAHATGMTPVLAHGEKQPAEASAVIVTTSLPIIPARNVSWVITVVTVIAFSPTSTVASPAWLRVIAYSIALGSAWSGLLLHN